MPVGVGKGLRYTWLLVWNTSPTGKERNRRCRIEGAATRAIIRAENALAASTIGLEAPTLQTTNHDACSDTRLPVVGTTLVVLS